MKTLDLGKEKISKLLLNFSIPCIIPMLVGALYNIVDQIFIGNGVGYLGNAATNIVYPFTVVALSLALLIGDGASALFSLNLGKKDYEKVVCNARLYAHGGGACRFYGGLLYGRACQDHRDRSHAGRVCVRSAERQRADRADQRVYRTAQE